MATQGSIYSTWLKLSPFLLISILVLPVVFGLAGVVLPAFGWLPSIGETSIGLHGFAALLNAPGIKNMLLLSVFTSFASTLLAVTICVFILAHYFNRPLLNYIQRLLSPILAIPHAAAAIAIGFLVTPSGMLSRIFSPWLTTWQQPPDFLFPNDPWGISIILALTIKELPFILLMAMAALAQKDVVLTINGHYKVALSLGYHPITAFFKVVLPTVYPFIRLPILAVLAYSSAAIEVPLILGPNTPPTFAVALMQWVNDVDLSLRIQASAGALLQIALTIFVVACWLVMEKVFKVLASKWFINGKTQHCDWLLGKFTNIITFLIVVIAILALLSLVMWSLAGYWYFPDALPKQLVLTHWQQALMQMDSAIVNSILIALLSTSIAVLLSLFVLEAEQQENCRVSAMASILVYFPMLIPSISFLFGLVWLQELLGGVSSIFELTFGHLLFVLPYVFLALASSYKQLDPRFAKVGACLGSSPFRVFYSIKLPQLVAPISLAFALGMAISYSQYLPTLLLGGGRIETITTEAVVLASGASRRTSAVYVLMQLILPACGFALAWLVPKIFFNPNKRAI